MGKDYEMITVANYLKELEDVKCTSITEREIESQVEKYMLNQKRYNTDEMIIEALLA